MDFRQITNQHLAIGSRLGQGAYGKVIVVNYNGNKVAKKVFNSGRLCNIEYNILQQCGHPNIIRFLDKIGRSIYIELGNLTLDDIIELRDPISDFEIGNYFYQALHGLAYLHSIVHVAHFDIKPSNIILTGLHNSIAKIIDLGVATDPHAIYQHRGTIPYSAPEILEIINPNQPNIITYKVDSWSISLTFLQLVHRYPFALPHNHQNPTKQEMHQAITAWGIHANGVVYRRNNHDINQLLLAIIIGGLSHDPFFRMSAHEMAGDIFHILPNLSTFAPAVGQAYPAPIILPQQNQLPIQVALPGQVQPPLQPQPAPLALQQPQINPQNQQGLQQAQPQNLTHNPATNNSIHITIRTSGSEMETATQPQNIPAQPGPAANMLPQIIPNQNPPGPAVQQPQQAIQAQPPFPPGQRVQRAITTPNHRFRSALFQQLIPPLPAAANPFVPPPALPIPPQPPAPILVLPLPPPIPPQPIIPAPPPPVPPQPVIPIPPPLPHQPVIPRPPLQQFQNSLQRQILRQIRRLQPYRPANNQDNTIQQLQVLQHRVNQLLQRRNPNNIVAPPPGQPLQQPAQAIAAAAPIQQAPQYHQGPQQQQVNPLQLPYPAVQAQQQQPQPAPQPQLVQQPPQAIPAAIAIQQPNPVAVIIPQAQVPQQPQVPQAAGQIQQHLVQPHLVQQLPIHQQIPFFQLQNVLIAPYAIINWANIFVPNLNQQEINEVFTSSTLPPPPQPIQVGNANYLKEELLFLACLYYQKRTISGAAKMFMKYFIRDFTHLKTTIKNKIINRL